MSMNVCIIVNSLYMGGAEKVALSLAKEFHDRGLNVDLLVLETVAPSYDIENCQFDIYFLIGFLDH